MKMKKYKEYLLERFRAMCMTHTFESFDFAHHDFSLEIGDFIYVNGDVLYKEHEEEFTLLAAKSLEWGYCSNSVLEDCPLEHFNKTIVHMATTYLLEKKLRRKMVKIYEEVINNEEISV